MKIDSWLQYKDRKQTPYTGYVVPLNTSSSSVKYEMECASPPPPGELQLNISRTDMLEYCQNPAKKFLNNIQVCVKSKNTSLYTFLCILILLGLHECVEFSPTLRRPLNPTFQPIRLAIKRKLYYNSPGNGIPYQRWEYLESDKV